MPRVSGDIKDILVRRVDIKLAEWLRGEAKGHGRSVSEEIKELCRGVMAGEGGGSLRERRAKKAVGGESRQTEEVKEGAGEAIGEAIGEMTYSAEEAGVELPVEKRREACRKCESWGRAMKQYCGACKGRGWVEV